MKGNRSIANHVPRSITSSTSYNEESGIDFYHDYDYYESITNELHGVSSNNNSFPPNNHDSLLSSQQYYIPRSKSSINDDWAKLFPDLWKAYLRVLGLYTIDTTKSDIIVTRKCSCDIMDTNKVICVFKCGIKRDISVLSCNICETFSLTIVHMELHMFPCSPKLLEVAIRIDVMDTCFRQKYIQRQAITNRAQLVQNEFPRIVPKSPIYSKIKIVIDYHLEQSYDFIPSDICPACMFETHDENSSPLLVKNVPDDSGHYLLNLEYYNLKKYWVAKPIISKTRTNSVSLSGQQKKIKGGLNETGVFGSTCAGHGFPLFFISMTTFDYPISILNQIKQRYGTNIGVLYDVACTLKPSLHQLKDILMGVSVWHDYNHIPQCQIDFQSRLLPGKTLKTKYARAAIIKGEASKKLENYKEKRSQPIPALGTYNQAKENLRQPLQNMTRLLRFCMFKKLICIQRVSQYSKQLKAARARVEKELKAYNDIRGEGTNFYNT
ncbi:hypothetical protein BDC45DRAFT_511481 [Circinella umbellata]|nr:hypothetical protein BDC45DRAFT_511481 [Circinella umbellata]